VKETNFSFSQTLLGGGFLGKGKGKAAARGLKIRSVAHRKNRSARGGLKNQNSKGVLGSKLSHSGVQGNQIILLQARGENLKSLSSTCEPKGEKFPQNKKNRRWGRRLQRNLLMPLDCL